METEKNEFFQFMEANLRSEMTIVNTLRHMIALNNALVKIVYDCLE